MDTKSDYQRAMEFLFGRINYEKTTTVPYSANQYKLDRMRKLLLRLGQPQLKYPAVHIAGTKGKGSVATMTSRILEAAGYKVGTYTSPHLESVEERLQIGGQVCPASDMQQLLAQLQPVVQQMDDEFESGMEGASGCPTYFEIITAAAMLYFAQQEVDIAVLEVGLGGRLDSTNVCNAVISVITSISFDHTRQLGNTLEAIAREKAGIIKSGIPVITGVTESEPLGEIQRIATEHDSVLKRIGADFDVECVDTDEVGIGAGCQFDYRTLPQDPGALNAEPDDGFRMHGVHLNLVGKHQIHNAGVAIAAVTELRQLGWNISEDAIRTGLSRAACPGRIECVSGNPTYILDAAHNVASVQALVNALQDVPAGAHRVLVFATSKDKDLAGMLNVIVPAFDEIIFTQFTSNPRSTSPARLLELANDIATNQDWSESSSKPPSMYAVDEPRSACDLANRLLANRSAQQGAAEQDGIICVAGSFFIVAELRPIILDTNSR